MISTRVIISTLARTVLAAGMLSLSGCASLLQGDDERAQLTPEERYEKDGARLKRIFLKRSIDEVKGTAKLTELPTVAVDESRGDWRQIGALNITGKVYKIAISQQNPKVVYAAYGAGGIWATRDGGTTWRAVTPRTNNPNWYFTVAVDPTNDLRIAAGVGDIQKLGRDGGFQAVMLSEDGGATWKTISPPDLGTSTTVRILFNPADPRSMVVVTTRKLYRTDDAGATWRTLFSLTYDFGGDGWGGIPDVAVHPTNFNIMLLAHPGHGLQRSADGGVTWQALGSQITDIGTTVLAWSISSPGVVYLQTYKNPGGQPNFNMRIWRSTDAGLTWQFRKSMTEFHQGRYDMSLVVDPADSNHVIAGNASFVVSSDGFANYTTVYCCSRVDILDVQFDPSNPKVVYVGADQGLYRAIDGGANIRDALRADNGVQTLRVFSFDVTGDSANPIGLLNAQDYYDFRGQISAPLAWTGINGYEYTAIHASPLDPGLAFILGHEQRLRRTTDSGQNWEDVEYLVGDEFGALKPAPRPYYGMVAFHPTDANIVYAADRVVWRSNAKGALGSWVSIGPPDAQVQSRIRALKVASSNPDVIVALNEIGDIYYTLNAGSTWQTQPLGTSAFALDVHPANPARVIIGSAFDLSLCDNYGATCSSIRTPTTTIDTAYRWVRFSPDGAEIWAGTDFGVLVTADQGVTWRRVGNNLPLIEVLDLKYRNNRWIASNHQGAWELRADNYGQPLAPTAAANVIPGGIRVTWGAVAGAQDYQVFRDGVQVFQGTAGDLVFPDREVTAGRQYCYRVGASNSQGSGTRSAPQCVTFSVVAGDTTPNTFAFAGATNVFLGRETTSNTVTVTGIDSPTVITATGGTYSIGCGANFTTSPGIVTNGQTVCVRHTTSATGQASATTTLTIGGVQSTFSSTTAASNVRAQVASYYRTILRREADAGGLAYWDAEAARVKALGVNVNETWYAMAGAFYSSGEYVAFNRDNAGFVTDLYGTFFNRAPDATGFTDWTGQLAAGMPREVVLASFMFSAEFANYTQAIFGTTVTRKEIDTVGDFYRGLLARLPDDGGFNFWVQQFRTAQCQGAAAVTAQAESISSQYAQSGEYSARNRSNPQYVGDLYNAFLRRGGDLGGVQFWISQIATGAQTREAVRKQFVASGEFSNRVAAIIAQGCLQ